MFQQRNPKFIIMGIGSRGDTNALMWLAEELVRRGRRCHLIGTEPLREQAARSGVQLTVVAPAQRNNLVPACEAYQKYTVPTYDPTYRVLHQELEAGEDLVIVNRSGVSPATQVCEKYGLPQVRTYVAPSQLKSFVDPPWPLKRESNGRFRNAFLKYQLPHLYEKFHTLPGILEPLNQQRRKLGLKPISNTACLDENVDRFVGFFPDWFSPPAPDWHPIDLVGFPLPQEGGALPESFLQLVATRGNPIVFTPGTGVVDVEAFFEAASECCRRLRMPGVFLSPHYRPKKQTVNEHILHYKFIPLESVLKKAAFLVHHGGIGTTARALQAGVPQIVVPQAYDQPDNGGRVTSLGVGGVVQPSNFTADSLTTMAEELAMNPSVSDKLAKLSSKIDDNSAISRAADLLEQQFVQRSADSHHSGSKQADWGRMGWCPVRSRICRECNGTGAPLP